MRILLLTAAAALVLSGCGQAPQAAPAPPKPSPVKGWKTSVEKSFALSAGQAISLPLPAGNTRFEIRADSGVTYTVIPTHALQAAREKRGPAVQPAKGLCFQGNVLHDTRECKTPDASWSLVVQDERNTDAAIVGAVIVVVAQDSTVLNQATAANRVTVVLYRWTCIANCS